MTTRNVAVGDILTYTYTGAAQSETLPAGTYKLECWGAQGGDYSTSYKGGRGGYSVGTLTLEEDTDLFIYVGGAGAITTKETELQDGGFNGGGSAFGSSTSSYRPTSGGGGSDIRLGTDSLYARVIVAGGGGGVGGRYHVSQAGHGGGTTGQDCPDYSTSYYGGNGGSQTAGGTSYSGTSSTSTAGTFGVGGYQTSYYAGGGGGGWYGGGSGRRAGGGGGSGYVYTESTESNYPSGCLLTTNYYLTDASTTQGTTSGREGNGEVIITVLELPSGGRLSTIVPSYGEPTYIPSTWSGGTDAEIVEALEKHYAGEVDLTEYWQVGDERTVSLSAMSATGVGESHAAQDVTMVLMNVGGKTLSDGETECAFIVGQKDSLNEAGYMNSSDTNENGWDGCARRTWCNNTYRDSIPSTLRGIFKQYNNVTANGSSSTTATSVDYFALPAEKEVYGSVINANSIAESSLSQFKWYETATNEIKNRNGSVSAWWERSPNSYLSTYFCGVSSDGVAGVNKASTTLGIAPFGVI